MNEQPINSWLFHGARKARWLAASLSALGLWAATDRISSARAATLEASPPSAWADFIELDFPFFSSVLDARRLGAGWPEGNLTPRGLILNLGEQGWACFDLDLLRMAALWEGAAVTPVAMSQGSYQLAGVKAPPGQERLPEIAGTPWLANGIYPGWQIDDAVSLTDPREPTPDVREVGRGPIAPELGCFRRLRLTNGGVILEYQVGNALIQERVEARRFQDQIVMQRAFRIGPRSQSLSLVLGQAPRARRSEIDVKLEGTVANGLTGAKLIRTTEGVLTVKIEPSEDPMELRVGFCRGGQARTWKTSLSDDSIPQSPALRWPQVVMTRGVLSTNQEAYVTDNIEIPIKNPWHRNVRLADLAFFPLASESAAGVTFDGDVWMIRGLKGDLSSVQWRRYASGFHEPLGLCVRGGELLVNDRNGIWRVLDTDGNGEADTHELFSDAFSQTAETREFATGIRPAPDGSLIISKGGQQSSTLGRHNGTVLRIAADGKSAEVLGWGLRMPFIGVHPRTGLVTASDQQGHYVPSTPLHIIRDRQYYGFLTGLEVSDSYPAPIADPLTWIPHPVNPSGVSQVWLTDARMGPLNEAMIHLGYYRPEIFLVRWQEHDSRPQAGVVSLTRDLKFPLLNGAVNPSDGQLYVIGFQIWGSEAPQISGLARLRYTGIPNPFPREIVAMKEGVLLRFDVSLDEVQATNPANYSAERWNYRRTAAYGSPHYKRDGTKGQETLVPSSAYLAPNGRDVFIGIPHMEPVMQMRVGWALKMKQGERMTLSAYFTPYELNHFNPVKEGFEAISVDLRPRHRETVASIPITVEEGRRVAELMGCVACHSNDGSTLGKVGPSWKGLFGNRRNFADGSQTVADEAYVRQSIKEPTARVVKGFEKTDTGMPSYDGVITEEQLEALLLYIKALR